MRKWKHYFSNYVYEAFKSFRFAVWLGLQYGITIGI